MAQWLMSTTVTKSTYFVGLMRVNGVLRWEADKRGASHDLLGPAIGITRSHARMGKLVSCVAFQKDMDLGLDLRMLQEKHFAMRGTSTEHFNCGMHGGQRKNIRT
jgi:hypothetical protein